MSAALTQIPPKCIRHLLIQSLQGTVGKIPIILEIQVSYSYHTSSLMCE